MQRVTDGTSSMNYSQSTEFIEIKSSVKIVVPTLQGFHRLSVHYKILLIKSFIRNYKVLSSKQNIKTESKIILGSIYKIEEIGCFFKEVSLGRLASVCLCFFHITHLSRSHREFEGLRHLTKLYPHLPRQSGVRS